MHPKYPISNTTTRHNILRAASRIWSDTYDRTSPTTRRQQSIQDNQSENIEKNDVLTQQITSMTSQTINVSNTKYDVLDVIDEAAEKYAMDQTEGLVQEDELDEQMEMDTRPDPVETIS